MLYKQVALWGSLILMHGQHPLDPNADGFPESLAQGLRLAHLQGEDLAASKRREGCVRAEGLCNACRVKGEKSSVPATSHGCKAQNDSKGCQ